MKVRKMRFTNKLIIGVAILFLVSDVILGVVAYSRSYNMLLDQIKSTGQSAAAMVASRIDAEKVI